jgi:hypothetical protein
MSSAVMSMDVEGESVLSLLLGVYSGVELLGHYMVTLFNFFFFLFLNIGLKALESY